MKDGKGLHFPDETTRRLSTQTAPVSSQASAHKMKKRLQQDLQSLQSMKPADVADEFGTQKAWQAKISELRSTISDIKERLGRTQEAPAKGRSNTGLRDSDASGRGRAQDDLRQRASDNRSNEATIRYRRERAAAARDSAEELKRKGFTDAEIREMKRRDSAGKRKTK
jgi:hypothetical protein